MQTFWRSSPIARFEEVQGSWGNTVLVKSACPGTNHVWNECSLLSRQSWRFGSYRDSRILTRSDIMMMIGLNWSVFANSGKTLSSATNLVLKIYLDDVMDLNFSDQRSFSRSESLFIPSSLASTTSENMSKLIALPYDNRFNIAFTSSGSRVRSNVAQNTFSVALVTLAIFCHSQKKRIAFIKILNLLPA